MAGYQVVPSHVVAAAAAEERRVRTRLARERGGEVVADEKRVVRGRVAAGHEQGRGQRARRQPGGGRRRRVSAAVREGTLQQNHCAF